LATGRGERLEALPAPVERFAVIVTPAESGSDRKTERLYGLLGPEHYSDGFRTAEVVRRIRVREPVGDALFNSFAAVASSAFDSFELACTLLGTTPAEHTLLAGSGPSLFALTDDEQVAEAVRQRVVSDGYAAWFTRLLSV
jgi:4-diphosphocytidyl-2C-methyl-D-erythritol kinase